MSKVLITGAAGFIGMHTVIKFLSEGFDVIGLDNLNAYYDISLKKERLEEIYKQPGDISRNFQFIETDLNSSVWFKLKKEDITAVVHLAAQAGVRYSIENPKAYLDSNILGFQKVLDFVVEKNIQKFLFASSSSVYGKKDGVEAFHEKMPCNNPESFYAATKLSNELTAHSYKKTKNLRYLALRFFTVYGPFGRPDMAPWLFTEATYLNKSMPLFNYGDQKRDFTYIDDVAKSIFLLFQRFEVAEARTNIINVSQGRPNELIELINAIEFATGNKLKVVPKPAQIGDVKVTYGSSVLLNSITEQSPQVDLHAGILKFVKWYESYIKL